MNATATRNPRLYVRLNGSRALIVTGKRGRPGIAGTVTEVKTITGRVPTGYGYAATFVRVIGTDGRKWVGQLRNATGTIVLRPGR